MQSTITHIDSSVEHPIILFDGVCNLCDGFVQFIIKRDASAQFRFGSLQSEIGQALLQHYKVSTQDLSTVVLIENDRAYTHSDVALRVAKRLGGFWTLFYIFNIIPRPIRDLIYNWIANNRYNWFGKKDQCMIPTPELRSRFLS